MPSPGATKSSTATRRVLKIVSKCNSVAEFVAVFQRFCGDDSLFVVTRTPKPVDSESRLAVTLADGKPMLMGAGRVVDSYDSGDNPFGRPGMRIEFTDLDDDSAATLARLNQARAANEAKRAAAADPAPAPGNGVPARPRANGKKDNAKHRTIMGAASPPIPRAPLKIPDIPRITPSGGKAGLAGIESPAVRPEATPPPMPIAPRPATPSPADDAPTSKLGSVDAPTAAVSPKKTLAMGAVPIPIDSARTPPSDSVPTAIDDEVTNVAPDEMVEDEITRVSPDNEQSRSTGDSPTGEQRVEGSDFILPANPFGEVEEASLEHFVECTLYEETGSFNLDDMPPEGDDAVPPWWPEGGSDPSKTPLPPAAPGMLPHGDLTGEIHRDQAPVPMPMGFAPTAPAGSHPLAMAPVNPQVIAPLGPARARPTWLPIVVTAGVTAAVTLLIGYLVFGGERAPAPQNAAPASSAEPAAAATAPEPAAAKMTETAEPAPAAATGDDDRDDDAPTPAAAAAPAVAAADDDAADDDAADDDAADDDAADDSGDDSGDDDGPAIRTVGDGDCTMTLTASATHTRAYVDGKLLGEIPLTARVPCDARLLEVKHPRYKHYERKLSLRADKPYEMRAQMSRPTVQLRLVSYPAGATVYVRGRKVGVAPLTYSTQGFLTQTIKMVKKGYKPVTMRVYPKQPRTYVRGRLER